MSSSSAAVDESLWAETTPSAAVQQQQQQTLTLESVDGDIVGSIDNTEAERQHHIEV
jgi:hypothetical protein